MSLEYGDDGSAYREMRLWYRLPVSIRSLAQVPLHRSSSGLVFNAGEQLLSLDNIEFS
ncbi:hypothetical protein J6590_075381, partial [Homalodisca vitripennis]